MWIEVKKLKFRSFGIKRKSEIMKCASQRNKQNWCEKKKKVGMKTKNAKKDLEMRYSKFMRFSRK